MGILSAKTATLLLSCFTGLSTAADLPSDEPCLSACMLATGIQTSFEAVNSTWDSDTTPWQLRIQPDPTGVAFPKTHDEVAASLACARECTTKVTARCGGHSYGSYGVGQNSGAFVIDMVNFKNMSYDASTELFTYGGGSILSDGASWLWNNHARHFPHVRGNRVGLSGSSIGSGFGSTSRFLGTPMDYLHSVEYMLYNGSIVTASKTENSDLFFVAQGAGSSYGILLSLTTKTWKPVYDQVTNFTLSFGDVDIETGVEALLAIQEYVLSGDCPDELALRWQITTPPWSGAGFYYGDPSTFDAIIAPLMERLPVKANLTSAVGSFWEMEIIATPGLDTQVNTFPPRNFYTQAVVLRTDEPFTYDSAFALYNSTTYSFNRTDMTKFGFMDLWGGVSRDIKDTDTSYAHANNLWLVRWEGRLASGLTEFPADGIDYLRSQMKPFEQHLLDQGQKIHGFVNYRDTALTEEEWSSRLYADNYPRMKQIKAAIDPIAMFNTNDQSIPLP